MDGRARDACSTLPDLGGRAGDWRTAPHTPRWPRSCGGDTSPRSPIITGLYASVARAALPSALAVASALTTTPTTTSPEDFLSALVSFLLSGCATQGSRTIWQRASLTPSRASMPSARSDTTLCASLSARWWRKHELTVERRRWRMSRSKHVLVHSVS